MASDGGGKYRTKRNRNCKPYERPKSFIESVKERVNKVFPVSWLGSWSTRSDDSPSTSRGGPPPNRNLTYSWQREEAHGEDLLRHNLNLDTSLPQVNGDETTDGEGDDGDSIQTEAVSESSLNKLKGTLGRLTRNDEFARQTHSLLQTDDTDKSSDEGAARSSTPLWNLNGPQPCASSVGLGGAPMFNVSRFRSSLPSSARSSMSDLSGKESPFYMGRTMYGGASASSRAASLLPRTPYQLNRSRTVRVKPINTSSSEDPAGLSTTAQKIMKTLAKMSTPVRDAQKIPPPLSHSNNSQLIDELCKTPTLRHRPSLFSPSTRTNNVRNSGPPVGSLSTPSPLTIRRAAFKSTPKPAYGETFKSSVATPQRTLEVLPEDATPVRPAETLKRNEVSQVSYPQPSRTSGKVRTKITSARHISKAQLEEQEFLEEPDLPNVGLPMTSFPTINFLSNELSKQTEKPTPTETTKSSSLSMFTFAAPTSVKRSMDSLKFAKARTSNDFKFSSPLSSSETQEEKSGFCDSDTEVLKQTSSDSAPTEEDSDSVSDASSCGVTKEVTAPPPPLPTVGFGDQFKKPVGNWECDSCMVSNKAEASKCCETPKPGAEVPKPSFSFGLAAVSSTPVGFGDAFKKPSGSWTCDGCWVVNKSEDERCSACETKREGSAPKSEGGSLANFKFGASPSTSANDKKQTTCKSCSSVIQSGNELCSTCQNSKTTAAAAPSSSDFAGFGQKFKMEAGSWACDGCYVQNKKDALSCAACEAKKPGSEAETEKASTLPSKDTSAGFGDAFKMKKGEWTCDGCYVRNKEELARCCSCEAPKPGSKSGKAEVASSGKCPTCNVQMTPGTTRCPACNAAKEPSGTKTVGGFTFPVGSGSTTSSTQGFTFGLPGATAPTGTSATATGFKFGVQSADSSSEKKEGATGFQFGNASQPASTAPASGFKFGASAPTDAKPLAGSTAAKTEEATGFKFGSSATTTTAEGPATTGGFKFGSSSSSDAAMSKAFSFGNQSALIKKEEKKEAPTEAPFSFGSMKPAGELKTGSVLDFLSKKDNLVSKDTSTKPQEKAASGATEMPKPTFTFGAKPVNQEPSNVNVAVTLPLPKPQETVKVAEKRTRPEDESGVSDSKKPLFNFGSGGGGMKSDSDKKNVFVFGSGSSPFPQGTGFGGPQQSVGGGAPSSGTSFGNLSGVAQPTMFGGAAAAPPPPATAPGFGSGAAPPSLTGFGDSSKQAPVAAKTAFGEEKPPAAPSLFAFGTSTSKPTTFGDNSSSAMSFGSNNSSNPTPPGTFGGFGSANAPAPSSGGFSFGVAQPQATPFQFSAGAATTSLAATQPSAVRPSFNPASIPSGFQFSQGAPNLNFGSNASAPGQPFTFSAPPSQQPQQPSRVYRKAYRRIKK